MCFACENNNVDMVKQLLKQVRFLFVVMQTLKYDVSKVINIIEP